MFFNWVRNIMHHFLLLGVYHLVHVILVIAYVIYWSKQSVCAALGCSGNVVYTIYGIICILFFLSFTPMVNMQYGL